MRINAFAEHFLPPGQNTEKELNTACLSLLMIIICGILSLATYSFGHMSITSISFGGRVFTPEAGMLPFDELLRGRFIPFWIHTALCLRLCFQHYRSFYEDSMSIYVMKRLRDPLELHVRCITVPLLLFLAGVILALVLILLLLILYNYATPAAWHPADNTLKLWQLFLP